MRRPAAVLALGLIAGLALTGCRTSPNVAAYVGDETISVDALEQAVDERLSDPAIADAVGDGSAEFTQQVLTTLINQKVFAAAADRYGVEVDESDVRERISALLGGEDPDDAYTTLAAQGLSREDVDENVMQQLVVEGVAVAAGEADPVDPAALRAQYQALLTSQDARPLGIITVADQATADQVVAALEADPSTYEALATANAGQYTLGQVDSISPSQLPPALAAELLASPEGTVFAQPVPEFGGVTVVYVPTFDDVAFALGQQPRADAQQAGAPLVLAVADDLDVSVNPRFGTYDAGSVVPADSDVVRFLDESASPSTGSSTGGGGTGGTGSGGSGSGGSGSGGTGSGSTGGPQDPAGN